MSIKTHISPSLMCMNLAKFIEQISFMNTVVDYYHVDIMDGHYVPNLTLSNMFVQQLKEHTTIPIEVHYMVESPLMFVDEVVDFGASMISVHPETLQASMFRFIYKMQEKNVKVGVVLNPDTSINVLDKYIHHIDKITVMTVDPGFAGQPFIPEMLEKINSLSQLKKEKGYSYIIEVDGGCNPKTFKNLINAGAESLVVGTSGLFNNHANIKDAWEILIKNIKGAEP